MAKDKISGSQVEDENVASDEEEKEEELKDLLKKSIKIELDDAGVLRKKLKITVPRDDLDRELGKDYKELIREAIVPGFRRGRAPRRLVEKRFGSEVGEQVLTRLISNAYLAATEKEDIKAIGDPMVWVKVKDKKAKNEEARERLLDMASALKEMKLPDEGDLAFQCEVELKPEFELPELEGVEIEERKVEVTDELVAEQIKRMLAMRGSFAPVLDGKIETDDLVVCDMKMTVDGKQVKTQDNLQLAARPQQIEGVTIDDLGDVLKGAKLGDTKKVDGELPEDYADVEIRGKKVTFELKINEIKRMQLPPLDKEFLESMGFDSEAEYRSHVRERMEGQLGDEVKRSKRNQVREYLLENTELELPEGLSNRQTERAVVRQMVELQRRGIPQAEIEKHADELRTGAREQAINDLKLYFILEEIAEKLEIEVTEEEINGQIAAMAQAYNQRFDRVRDELARNNGIESLYLEIRDEKCVDSVLEKAKFVEAKPEAKKPARKSAAKKAKAKADKGEESSDSGGKTTKKTPQRKPPPKK